ncbi:hypothetical protein [Flavobacterium sp. CS20]|uniref:hypothetical protein n=1 Tax=Flavobacterium sp. CS20 TaxID=2775246 RepID=UPI001B39F7FC|nr:hypothetical protein [Flavobacterium sp. CS20]QTY27319.1 hypothetical protein IGB25_01680 [Flavobacterium sp. CS20]
MKKINILLLPLFLSVFDCNNNDVDKTKILGYWNLIHVYNGENDLLGNDKVKEFYYFRSMDFLSDKIDQLTMEIDRENYIYADFRIKGDTLFLTRNTDEYYNGKYILKLKDTTSVFFKEDVTSITLTNFNKDILIYGLRLKNNDNLE